ncbi:MAG: GspH/FimT family pseudopilin [Burkholderiales bacterium]|nr:GspH/FimT family pseudopilin [Burkholderiales bacterium]
MRLDPALRSPGHRPRRVSAARCAPSGFTFLELIVALTIGGILLTLALPGYHTVIADLELRDRVTALTNALAFARGEALKRGVRVDVCPSADGTRCADDGRWERGWITFADTDGDGDRGDDEPLLRVEPASQPRISVRGNRPVRDYVSYTAFGHTRMASGALQMGTFTVCRSGRPAVEVVLANGGRVRVARTGVTCP